MSDNTGYVKRARPPLLFTLEVHTFRHLMTDHMEEFVESLADLPPMPNRALDFLAIAGVQADEWSSMLASELFWRELDQDPQLADEFRAWFIAHAERLAKGCDILREMFASVLRHHAAARLTPELWRRPVDPGSGGMHRAGGKRRRFRWQRN